MRRWGTDDEEQWCGLERLRSHKQIARPRVKHKAKPVEQRTHRRVQPEVTSPVADPRCACFVCALSPQPQPSSRCRPFPAICATALLQCLCATNVRQMDSSTHAQMTMLPCTRMRRGKNTPDDPSTLKMQMQPLQQQPQLNQSLQRRQLVNRAQQPRLLLRLRRPLQSANRLFRLALPLLPCL